MDNRQFAEGYKTPASHTAKDVERDMSPEVTEIMQGPRKWSSFFDTQLTNYLKGTPDDSPVDTFRAIELDYSLGWVEPHLLQSVMDIRKLDTSNQDVRHAANELHFHVLNRELLPMWHRILLPEFSEGIPASDLYIMQVKLSIHAAEITNAARKAKAEDERLGIMTGMVGVFYGQLTEIDTAIVILEQLKEETEKGEARLVLLPAPQKYESGHHNKRRASDFILIDTIEKQARGVQVKTRITSLTEHPTPGTYINKSTKQPEPRYDNDFVTLVDGVADLGNSRVTPDRRGVISAPGLISLDFLHHNVSVQKLSKHPDFRRNLKTIITAKGIARELTGDRRPYLNSAKHHVMGRLSYDLYKEKSPINRETS